MVKFAIDFILGEMYTNRKYTYIDLFAGTSALSEGFLRCGFVPVAHVEMNNDACYTIKTRLAYHYLKKNNKYYNYIKYLKREITRDELYKLLPPNLISSVINKEISDESIESIFASIDSVLKRQHRKRVDFIVGGPPCQAFSMLNRHNAGIADDKRCFLYLQYGKFLARYKPMGFVFENVLGLLSSKKNHFENIKMHFRELGYKVHFAILNASDYGVMQNRQRVIIFGWRKSSDRGCPIIQKVQNDWTCKDIFSDLPVICAGESSSEYSSVPSDYLRRFGLRNDSDILTLHTARPINHIDTEKYRMAVEMWLNDGIRIKNSDFPDEIRTINNTTSFLDRFKVVDLNGKCHTVVAHISKDGHYYIYPSTRTIRSISIREAARIQSFPDDFFFEGSRSAIFKQIGNAVPPLMAYAIAKAIVQLL